MLQSSDLSARVIFQRPPHITSNASFSSRRFRFPATHISPGLSIGVSVCRLYELSSRRPVAFSPSAEMGLTDIEMAHNCDVDDSYFDDKQYEMVYEVSPSLLRDRCENAVRASGGSKRTPA